MDIQSAITGTYLTYNNSILNADNSGSVSVSTNASLPVKSDSVEISPQTTALTKALSSVAQDLEVAKNRGYPFPPPYVTNAKQLDIIKEMVKEKLSGSVDESTFSKATEMLWKNAGYRLDTAIRPGNTSGSGNIYNFLTKSDREAMDKVYDQAAADGVDAIKVTRETAAALSMKRMKEVDVANGVISYGESGITPLSAEDLAKLAEDERLKNALSSVEKEIGSSFNRGDPIPPMWLTNEKQIDLIKKMIIGKMPTPVDDSVVVKAAESLWKDAGYRVDTLPHPKDTSFGNVFNFLSKQDRKELDLIYDQAESDGLDAKKISGDRAFEVALKRMKEVDIANGGVYYDESYITPVSAEDLAKLAEDERIKMSQPQKSESLDTLQKSLSTMKKSLRLNELLLSFLQKNNHETDFIKG